MAAKSGIEWTESTWNPLVGCTKVSPGCDHCYAENLVNRFTGTSAAFPTDFATVNIRSEKFLRQPLQWREPRRIFVNSLSDLFHDDVPDQFIAKVFAVMGVAQRHTFQLLTKRHARMRSLLSNPRFGDLYAWELGILVGTLLREKKLKITDETVAMRPDVWPLPNVWLGVSVEDQKWADIRIPALLDTPAAVRFLSMEPLLGLVAADLAQINWVIVGGESGPGARPMHPDWARQIRDDCVKAGVPFLFKQWGEYGQQGWKVDPTHSGEMVHMGKKNAGRELDGRTWDEYPESSLPAVSAAR